MNRLKDLQKRSAEPPAPGTSSAEPSKAVAVSVPAPGANSTEGLNEKDSKLLEAEDPNVDPMERCFQLVAEVQTGNRNIQARTADLRIKSAEHRRASDLEGSGGTLAVQDIMNDVNKLAKNVKLNLDKLQALTNKLSATTDDEAANAATVKIQQNQHAHLTRVFTQAMGDYKEVCAENEKMLKEQTVRRIKLQYRDENGRSTMSDERAEELALQVLREGTHHDALFQQSQDMLHRIMETRDDLLKIETSLRELNEIFNDLAVLINEQGEIMDQILTNVQKSVQHVEKGRDELKKAKTYAKKSRKKMCWIIVIVFFVFLLILAPILGFTLPR